MGKMKVNLKAEADQKQIFQEIRNFLAGRMLGATRDAALLEEMMKCLFTKKQMLLRPPKRGRLPVDDIGLARLYRAHFHPVPGIFSGKDQILLDPVAIRFIDDRLSQIDFFASDRDPVGDLYETFIGAAIRGSEGQFFTPQNAGRWLVEAVSPSSGERVIDPACGAGGFLVWAAQYSKGLKLFGIEKDNYLAALARARTAMTDTPAKVYCANSLSFDCDDRTFKPKDLIGEFDIVLANPPFGKNIQSVSATEQKSFELGRKWKRDRSGVFEQTPGLATKAPPQVLFVERILSLLKKGGRAGIVVPESMIGSRSYGHVVQYIREHSAVQAIVGMPEALFKSSGKGGTHTKTCLLVLEKKGKQGSVLMAEAKWCGHDSRGRPVPKDDLPQISEDLKAFRARKSVVMSYAVPAAAIKGNILSPRYHEPAAARVTNHLATSHELITVQELVENGVIEIRTGNEVGKLAYGTGPVPFVRTSDISGWEIKIDPKHCVSEELYNELRASQDVRRNDILMVRDGTYLIGSCAIVTEYDERILYQSHIYKIRCIRPDRLSPYLLIASLSSDPVQRQIKAKTFTQDIIDSLGNRINELILPLPKSSRARHDIEGIVRKVIDDRVEARELARKAKALVVDPEFRTYSATTSAAAARSGSLVSGVDVAAPAASPSM